MDLRTCHTVIVFGGSFDPPHHGHLTLPTLAMQHIHADAVAYIPAAVSPLKQNIQQTPSEHRLAMLRLAVGDLPHAVVLTDEMDRAADNRPSYTVDTLEGLHQKLGDNVTMRLLIGGDQLQQFDRWRQPNRIIELAEPLVMLRPPQTRETLLASLPVGYDAAEWSPRIVELPPMNISSTMIRRHVAHGKPIREWVPAVVEQYVREHRLYQQASD